MNLILLRRKEVADGGRAVLDGRRAQHLARVVRVRPGDRVRVGLVRGPIGQGEIVRVREGRVELQVELDRGAPPRPPVDLVLAVARPKMLSRVLETAAAFGVGQIDLVNAWRVDKSYLASRRLEPAALERHLLLGCEQGGTTWVPGVEVHRLLVPFLERAPARWGGRGRLIAHARAQRPIEAALHPGDRRDLVVAVGPEGGWIEEEIESFAALGFAPVRLGQAVLRVEAAVPALLAQIDLLRRLAG